MAGSLIGRLPGLLTPPAGTWWIAERLAWLPAFAAALGIAWLIFHRAERSRRRPGKSRGAGRLPETGRTGRLPEAGQTGRLPDAGRTGRLPDSTPVQTVSSPT
jgi:hypothetical protein